MVLGIANNRVMAGFANFFQVRDEDALQLAQELFREVDAVGITRLLHFELRPLLDDRFQGLTLLLETRPVFGKTTVFFFRKPRLEFF